MKKLLFTSFVLLSVLTVVAQARYHSRLAEVPAGGFYQIDLPLSVRGAAQTNLSDLRILSPTGEQVPYLVRTHRHLSGRQEFIPCPIHRIQPEHPGTRIFIETGTDTLSSLVLNIKNADTWKKANLQGSRDSIHWYAVKEQILLADNFNRQGTSVLQIIDFPPSDYPYYLLTIEDSLSAPLNILEVGKIHTTPHAPYLQTRLPATCTIRQIADTTFVSLKYDASYPVSALQLEVSAPEFFRREAFLLNRSGYVAEQFTLSSDQPASLYMPCQLRTDSLTLMILNGDNPPLQIGQLDSYIRELTLIAYFPTSGKYEMTYGDPTASAPRYDLALFEDRIPRELPRLKVLSVEIREDLPDAPTQPWKVFLQRYGLWILIAAIIIQILYIVRKMMRE